MARVWRRGIPAAVLLCSGVALAAYRLPPLLMGRQPDGGYLVATGQRIEPGSIAFNYRPIDIALHPSGKFFAVLNQREALLANASGVFEDSSAGIGAGASFRGASWSPDGKRLYVSVSAGYVQELLLEGRRLSAGRRVFVRPEGVRENPRPGGMAITRDGRRLFVTAAARNTVAEIDLQNLRWVQEWKTQNLPFEVRLSQDEETLVVTNWGGRPPETGDEQAVSDNVLMVVDPRGANASGTVSLVLRATGEIRHISVGRHPTCIAVQGGSAWVANSADDTLSLLDLTEAKVTAVVPIRWGSSRLLGSMPGALAISGQTLYVCNGGDNAVCEVDLPSRTVRGFRPAGFYPTGIQLSPDGATAYVVNTKGNGSVRNTVQGKTGNAHDFQGTVSVIDLKADLRAATARVAANNGWNRDRAALRSPRKVYHGAIRHVLYIIKENRTYDEVFGDLPQGNGKKELCGLGELITPNQHALAQEFTLFDNTYVTGTNSAEGHQWATSAFANDYIERSYPGYRTYPDDGDDPMGISPAGSLWDAVVKAGKSLRVYGEFCNDDDAKIEPQPASWLDTWKDRQRHGGKYHARASTTIVSLKRYIHPEYIYWPLLLSDQWRADRFLEEYARLSREDRVPNLMIMSLPCDHTEGLDPKYPKPRSMVADNDLALGRVVEAVTNSPQWKETCIFVIEDDAQSGPDHIDGHRTVFLTISPYSRRRTVDSGFYTQISVVRSIEMMLGIPPMNRFDALTPPITGCFTDRPDTAAYHVRPNTIPLDDMNVSRQSLSGKARYWADQSAKLDWSGIDRPDPDILNRIIWHSLHGDDVPFPATR